MIIPNRGKKMKFYFAVILCFCSSLFAHEIRVQTDPASLKFRTIKVGASKFAQIEGVPLSTRLRIGLPELPRRVSWVAIDAKKTYTIEFTATTQNSVVPSLLLYPAQPDRVDDGSLGKFKIDRKAYRQNKWFGGETVKVGQRVRLGSLTLLPIEIYPVHYNPRLRQLRVVPDIQVRVAPLEAGQETLVQGPITEFVRDQAALLVDNATEVLAQLPEKIQRRVLILTPAELVTPATTLATLQTTAGIETAVEIIPAGTTPLALKAVIQKSYGLTTGAGLDAVILLGNEDRLPLYLWNGTTPGDVYYSLLSGDDNIADIALGRFPASTTQEAAQLIEKTRQYFVNLAMGTVRKNVMLVAHKEAYPGKYTANQEMIFSAANPLGLNFTRQYGGKDASNQTVIGSFPNQFGIINYRGHGSNTEWWAWGTDDRSFTESEVDLLGNGVGDLAIYFNIACDTGAIHLSERTLAEAMLFRKATEPYEGAVAVVASTEPSYTETNHRFDRYLFEGMQVSQTASLGSIYAQANNRLVQDEAGEMPENVTMYLLFGHPLLPMPYQTR